MDIYVSNLPSLITSGYLNNLFKEHGDVSDVLWFKDRGFAIVKMTDPESTKKAIKALHRKEILGAIINVKKAPGLKTKRQRPKTYISREWREKAEFKE